MNLSAVAFTLNNNCKIFGPVLAVGKFRTEEEAIELANNTSYGLGAGLHSSEFRICFNVERFLDVSSDYTPFIVPGDANQCMRVSSALEAGTVSDLVATAARDVHCSNGDPPDP